jgi:P-type E1-E2 ATPase
MIELHVPGLGMLALEHLVLDLNGTIAMDGQVLPGVAERLAELSCQLAIHLLSADTRGLAADTARQLGVHLERVSPGHEGDQKQQFVERLGHQNVVAVGNGANDQQMLEAAVLGIAVLGSEGLAVASLTAADVVAGSIQDALDLLLNPQRLIATLRR